MTNMSMTGEGIEVEREVSESVALKIMEVAMDDEMDDDDLGVTLTLSGEGMQFKREITEKISIRVLNTAVQADSNMGDDAGTGDSGSLPVDFFDRLSSKQRIMLEILLEADGEWMRGVDIRKKMREEYDLDVGEGGRATAGVIAGLTRKYNEEFRREVIPGRWADETQQHAEFTIGDKYKGEIEEWFEEQ